MVQGELRAMRSTAPVWRSAKRLSPERVTNSILPGSLKIATATARQKSTSKPVQRPSAAGCAKPGSGSVVAQMT
ncbi:hypothetical protein D3C83_120960 [compost metagenome]